MELHDGADERALRAPRDAHVPSRNGGGMRNVSRRRDGSVDVCTHASVSRLMHNAAVVHRFGGAFAARSCARENARRARWDAARKIETPIVNCYGDGVPCRVAVRKYILTFVAKSLDVHLSWSPLR